MKINVGDTLKKLQKELHHEKREGGIESESLNSFERMTKY